MPSRFPSILFQPDGPSYMYDGASPEFCRTRAVRGPNPEMRQVAAAGLVRAVIDVPPGEREYPAHSEALRWSIDLLLTTCSQAQVKQTTSVPKYIKDLPPISGDLDDVTIRAIRTNRPADLAQKIMEFSTSPDIFLVGLGHGGTISAARTFLELPSENNALHVVRFSPNKMNDEEPIVDPYEMSVLRERAEGRQVVILDEDMTTGNTIDDAARFFARLFTDNPNVLGVVPCIKTAATYKPQIFSRVFDPTSECFERTDYYT